MNDKQSSESAKRDEARWSFINSWKVAPQQNDREPVRGASTYGTGGSASDRAMARRRHQRMYKEWSEARHE
jgi:hypothetical protein